jgi:hypothetical protein
MRHPPFDIHRFTGKNIRLRGMKNLFKDALNITPAF